MNRLLLHQCCAPCSFSVIGGFSKDFEVTGFWFNPNIQPADEYGRRLASLQKYMADRGLKLIMGPVLDAEAWRDNALAEPRGRCEYCYSVRMNEAAVAAKKLGFKGFSTTLLSSPHQKHDLIKKIASGAALRHSVEFYYRDFRPLYYEGKSSAKKEGMYMQKYCGCIFSREERGPGSSHAVKSAGSRIT